MDLSDFLGPNQTVIELKAEDRWAAIEELIAHLVASHKIKAEHRDAITESVRKRESAVSTGMGHGIALPHATTELVDNLVGAIGRSRKGVQFDAVDGNLVNVVALFLVPKNQFQKHVHTLAEIARLVVRFRDQL